ncbi:MAG: PilN domain-containing protein [Candidatus Omnitrophota bacterium]|jgi:Tfp pilus assembly protein PilN
MKKQCGIFITLNSIRLAYFSNDDPASLQEREIAVSDLKDNVDQSRDCVLFLARSQVTIRCLKVPSIERQEIKKIIGYKLNKLFPYESDELVYDIAITDILPDGYAQVMLVVAKKADITENLDILKQSGVFPEAIDLSTFALFNQFKAQGYEAANYLLVNCENNFLEFLVVVNGKLLLSRGFNFSAALQLKTIAAEANMLLSIHGMQGKAIDKIVVTGRGAVLSDIAESLSDLGSVEVNEKISIVGGIALENNSESIHINLAPEEFKLQQLVISRNKTKFYFIALLILNISLVVNLVFLHFREKEDYLRYLKTEINKVSNNVSALQKMMIKNQAVEGYSGSCRLTLGLLTELYRLTPAGVWFTSLDIANQMSAGTLVIMGEAGDSETVLQFVSALKDPRLFKKADIQYISKSPSTIKQAVDFKIRAQY